MGKKIPVWEIISDEAKARILGEEIRIERLEKIKRLVVFAILMEHDEGIMSKSPEYIEEKYDIVASAPYPEAALDIFNQEKLARWMKEWGPHLLWLGGDSVTGGDRGEI